MSPHFEPLQPPAHPVLTSTAVRTDCLDDKKTKWIFDCNKDYTGWGFDLVVSDAAIDPAYPDCEAILCGRDVSSLNGTVKTYGWGLFELHILGMVEYVDPSWDALGPSKWDPGTGTLSYQYGADDVEYYK